LEGAYRAISEVFCSDCVDVFGVSPLGVDLSLKDEASKLGFVRCVPLNSKFNAGHCRFRDFFGFGVHVGIITWTLLSENDLLLEGAIVPHLL
jgi:hypothetical protein